MGSERAPVRILVVEDSPEIARLIRRSLILEGYAVEVAVDGRGALAALRDQPPSLLVLDQMLPDLDGLEITRRLRALERAERAFALPILMVSPRANVQDLVAGLEVGADDYLSKPFAIPELVARVKALLRRAVGSRDGTTPAAPAGGDRLRHGDLAMDLAGRSVTRGERTVSLTPRQFDLLACLLRHPNQVLTRQQLMQRVWGDDFYGESNVLAVTVRSLRRALEAPGEPPLVQTVRGVGYVLRGA